MILRVWIKNYGGLGDLGSENERRKPFRCIWEAIGVAHPICARRPGVARQKGASDQMVWRGVNRTHLNQHFPLSFHSLAFLSPSKVY